MDNKFTKIKAAAVLAALSLPPTAFADTMCLTAQEATDTSSNGRAIVIQGDQGQGSIDCTSFLGYDDLPMHPVTAVSFTEGYNNQGTIGTTEFPLKWTVTDADPDIHVDVLFISNSGDGSRCSQFYTNNARSGYAGAGLKTNKDSTIVACADNHVDPQPAPTPTPPIATDQTNACTGKYQVFQDAIDASEDFHGLILFGPGVEEGNSGICTSKNVGNGNLKRCVNRCIKPGTTPDVAYNTPFYADPEQYEACTGDGPFYPIECRVCELHTDVVADPNSPNTEYCWEQIQKAELTSAKFPNGSFKKAPGSKGEQVWGIDRKHGSDCYLINGRTASGWPYSYWFPSNCPE